MGLDTVELLLAIEVEFEMEIPDEDAARLATVGAISDYVFGRLRDNGVKENEIWIRVRTVVVESLAVAPDKVTREAYIVRDLGAD